MIRYLLCWLLISSAFAAPVGNPGIPSLVCLGLFSSNSPLKFTSGYLADYTADLKLRLATGTAKFDPKGTFSQFGLHSQMASFSLVFLQRVETYALLGGTKERLKWGNEPQSSLYSSLFDFQSSYHFSWALGTKIVLLEWGQTALSFDGSYFAVPSSHKSFFTFLNRLNLPLENEKQYFYLREWQAGAALSSSFWILTPYAGAKYFKAKLKIQDGPDTTALTYRNAKSIGYYWGLTMSLSSRFQIALERRVHDEFAYMFSTQAVF